MFLRTVLCCFALAVFPVCAQAADPPAFAAPRVFFDGAPAPAPGLATCGFYLVAGAEGPQVAALGGAAFAACLRRGEEVVIEVPVSGVPAGTPCRAEVTLSEGRSARVGMSFDPDPALQKLTAGQKIRLDAAAPAAGDGILRLRIVGGPGECVVQWRSAALALGAETFLIPLLPPPAAEVFPPPVSPPPRPGIERALIEHDWRLRDGIGAAREPVTHAVAVSRVLAQGNALVARLTSPPDALLAEWRALEAAHAALTAVAPPDGDPRWEDLWRRTHWARRRLMLSDPLAQTGPILFAKHVPSAFSHQLTQVYGRLARAGGGLFVLESPGESMACRPLTDGLFPDGNFMHPEPTHDADRILFAWCASPSVPAWAPTPETRARHYHLYEIRPDGSGLRQLTDGAYDDFSPRELPSGKILFVSTRRGGFHRCGGGPCDVYTLAVADADGANPHPVSYHETNEWDPAVLADGRVVYTRWDYVDRNAVHYQQLWMTRPDGSAPGAFYGNNTFNPVGVWEARQVPGSPLIMATAAAHHAMTAGSVVLVDRRLGLENEAPLRRLTPDAPFPESETIVPPANWHAPGSPAEYLTPEEARRWPGHCYKSPEPLSETVFLVSYSYDGLIGEPAANPANQFGLYLADADGNRELLYRDPNISSLWAAPLRPRPRPPVIPPETDTSLGDEGLFYLQDVARGNYGIAPGAVKSLRIVQVLPKTTPNANNPRVGHANASPGKQVLGTVPVEADGSAYFRAPARIPLHFQILDERGRALQTMRSVTYLQPGEKASCVGCHESRHGTPPPAAATLAARREPSTITPGPDGSKPLSYPILVQPVLDRHCVRCHDGGPQAAPPVLTGDPEGAFSKSYNALGPLVAYTAWGGLKENSEPETPPGRFGAVASRLTALLDAGHHEVALSPEDMDRLTTWMDANALFYGTFKPEDQARQLKGERIEGPELN